MRRWSFLSYQKTFTRKSSFSSKPLSKTMSSSSFNLHNSPSKTFRFHPNMEEMRKVFDKYDANKDGRISLAEYKAALCRGPQDEEVARRAFEVADKDGDGFINFEEFLTVTTAGGGVSMADIGRAFMAFDIDGDGRISTEEVAEVMKRIGGEEGCGLEACRRMVRGVDKDGDGLIDMDEFTTMMTRTMRLVRN